MMLMLAFLFTSRHNQGNMWIKAKLIQIKLKYSRYMSQKRFSMLKNDQPDPFTQSQTLIVFKTSFLIYAYRGSLGSVTLLNRGNGR
jgi:hypothetical protein